MMAPQSASPSNFAVWCGRILGTLVTLSLLADAGVCMFMPHLLAKDMQDTGFAPALAPVIGALALISAAIYAIPRTAILGAILLTGFLGGAICAHLRLGEIGSPPQFLCIALGVAAWTSLYLRIPALRALLPVVTHSR